MTYGVTPQGFIKKRLPDIRQEIIGDLKSKLSDVGITDDIDTRPDSIIGLLIDTFAEREAAVWELQEGVYYAMYPDSANGISLDKSVGTVGMERFTNEKAKGYAVFYGSGNISKGTLIKNKNTGDKWQTAKNGIISRDKVADVLIRPEVINNHTYTITIDDTDYSYTSTSNAKLNSILAGLVAELPQQSVSVSSNGAVVRVTAQEKLNINLSLSDRLHIEKMGTRIAVESVDYIERGAEVGELSEIVTRVDGLIQVDNLEVAISGRKAETDSELRLRHQEKQFGNGKSILPAFDVALKSVFGVVEARTFQNNTNDVDDVGRPPHCVHCVVDGGLPEQIATTIYNTVAGGIGTYGNISRVINTSEGDQLIRFDRPTYKYIHAKAVVTKLPSAEEMFTSDGFSHIKQAILNTGNLFSIGADVVTQKFYGDIYKTQGIASVDLKFAVTDSPNDIPINFSANNITIADFEKAVFDLSRIEVT
ncbi:hypothetical protein [Phocoenobacter skyensis]|uniref:Baseplate protein J-like domain-containing protein n=1 Tax=Phocoenobacter skyensis TaxID=97481 RepID=A0ABT9JIF0_9PAST|nr:hypothetical protein [Pasteurella skyensis]MDP8078323.1 hypothetical protein [Pasteurella skyensis]MDP8084585.1 hypothetical protein [Pasteurella skyensis]